MSTDMSTPAEPKKIKHLEFTQAIITRFSSNSFIIKGWSITLTAALFTFAKADSDVSTIVIACITIPLFWCIDAYYLYLERLYRSYFDEIRIKKEEKIDFSLTPSAPGNKLLLYTKCLFAWPVLLLYSAILVTCVVLILIRIHVI